MDAPAQHPASAINWTHAATSCVFNKLINSVRPFTAGLVNSLNADPAMLPDTNDSV